MTTQRWRRRAYGVAALAAGTFVFAACADNSEHEQNTLEPHGTVARKQLDLLTPWVIVAAVIGLAVVGATVFFALKYRERPGNENPKQIHGHSGLEITWTIIPAVIMVAMAVPTVSLIWELDKKPADALEVTVYGKQWWWEYQYTNLDTVSADIDYQVNTANELHIPAGRPVYLTLRSTNVIHSFWVPSLAGKKDVTPGRDNHMWLEADPEEAGKVFYGQCAEYCGLSHADMRLRVVVDSPEDFAAWVAGQHEVWSEERVAQAADLGITTTWGCSSCHYLGGVDPGVDADITDADAKTGENARFGPNLTHLADRSSFAGAKYDLYDENGNPDVDALTNWIWHAPEKKPAQCNKPASESGTRCVGMPNFEKSGMTQAEAAAIARFLLELDQ